MTLKANNHLRFNPEVNAGQIFSGASIALGLLTLVWWQSSFQTSTAEQFRAMNEKIVVMDSVNLATRGKYIPIIETVNNAQSVTNDRLQNVGVALREVRDALRDTTEKIAMLQERIIKLEVTVSNTNKKELGMLK
jgi:hypothetical protein